MMKKLRVLPVMLLAASIVSFAMDWPSRDGNLVSNFGSNDQGNPVLGNSFTSDGSIYPSDVGKLVFYHDSTGNGSTFPSPLGSWAAIEHGDNLLGIYGRFENRGSAPAALVEKDTVLASAGSSGWTGNTGYYFAFFDRRERRWINPSMIITPLPDDRPPVIRQVELRSPSGASFNLAQVRTIPQGQYSIYVDAVDSLSGNENLAPNRIICSINGAEAGMLSFETLISKDGKRMVYRNGLVPAASVYEQWPGFSVADVRFTRGQATLVIEARDISENSRSVTYRLMVE